MSVTLSTDLSVTTAPCRVEEKMNDNRKALLESLRKGEPKIFGVSQIALGLLIISYSMPLLVTESSLIIYIGVPWWSGLMFVFSGATAIAVEKHARSSTNFSSALKSIISILIMVQTAVSSAFTVILYKVKNDIHGYTVMNEGHPA